VLGRIILGRSQLSAAPDLLAQCKKAAAGMRLLLRHGNPRGLPAEYFDNVYKTFDRGIRRAVLRLYQNTLNTEGEARQLTEALRPLDLPALVVWGAQDPYIPVEFAERQRQVFPRAEIKILPDSGHWPFVDDPGVVAQAALPFLRRQLHTIEPR